MRDANRQLDPNSYIEQLYESGCDDALIGIGKQGCIALDFIREASSGRILLGRAIDSHQIEKVFSNFGLKDLIKLNAEDIFKLVWEHRQVKSVGQWELQRNYYKGVDRLEVLAVYSSDKIDWLKAVGCFTEIIQHRTKVFVPVDNTVEIIDRLLTSK